MRFLHILYRLFLICIFPMLALPCKLRGEEIKQDITMISKAIGIPQRELLDGPDFSYDSLVDFLELLEDDEIEDYYSPQDLNNLSFFVALLAKRGMEAQGSWQSSELDEDLFELFYGPDIEYQPAIGANSVSNQRAIFQGDGTFQLCKSKGGVWNKTKRFVKKHKKPILIGAAVVVVAVTAYYTIPALAAKAGASAAAAGAAASRSKGHSAPQKEVFSEEKKPSEKITQPIVTSPEYDEMVKNLLVEYQQNLRDHNFFETQGGTSDVQRDDLRNHASRSAHEVIERFSPSISHIAHQVIDAAEELSHPMTLPLDLIDHSVDKLGEALNLPPAKYSPPTISEDVHNIVGYLHKRVDQLFGTDIAGNYTHESKEVARQAAQSLGVAIGELPMPGRFGNGIKFAKNFKPVPQYGKIRMTKTNKTIGWKAGDPIENLTFRGGNPTWSTVRQRYWKNQAYLHPERFDPENLERVKKGLAPRRYNRKTGNWESKELHHDPTKRNSGLLEFEELWPQDQAGKLEVSRSSLQEQKIRQSLTGLERDTKIEHIPQLEKKISEWLGEGTQLIRNKAGDPVFLSKDGLRRLRFDFKNSHGDRKHLHIEHKIRGKWKDASSQHRIYPNND